LLPVETRHPPPQCVNGSSIRSASDPALAPLGELLPARRQSRDRVRREETEPSDPRQQLAVDLQLPLPGEGAGEIARILRETLASGRPGDRVPPPERDAQVVESLRIAALESLAGTLERLSLGLPERVRFAHGALL